MLIFSSSQTDVYRNLAMEEWLLNNAPLPTLFLCVNRPCVVIGKNQNPWRECRLSLMEEEGVPLARRISGGGTVYHDEGNLNVGVIVPRTQYREDKQYELIFRALDLFGIRGERLGKNSLAVGGKKFSGQAFCFRRDRVLHHGTLLVSSDLKRLGRYLGPEIEGIETKAVASIPATVTNLADSSNGLMVGSLSAALSDTFRQMYGAGGAVQCGGEELIPDDALLAEVAKLASAEWRLCHTPRFQIKLGNRTVIIEKGRVCGVEPDSLFEEWRKTNAADV